MKKIKVYLQYPWKTSDSQYYRSLIENPPKNIQFISSVNKLGNITNIKSFAKSNRIKEYVRKIAEILKIPNIVFPNKKSNDADIIHCAHCLYSGKKPWVVDVEMFWSFSSSFKIAYSKIGKRRIKKFLKNKSCKKVIAWTNTAKKQIIEALKDKEIEKKIEIVSYALKPAKIKKSKEKGVTLLFLARYFYSKGGLQALKVMDAITKKYKYVDAIFIAETPNSILKKYSKNKKIKFLGLTSHEKIIKDIFPSSDIFIYPGFSDSFGFAIPEALSFGLPVISVDRFSRKDLIKDGKTGFVVDFPPITYKNNYHNGIDDGIPVIPNEKKIIDDFVKKASLLIENKDLLRKMSKSARKEIEKGKFSIEQRNKKLRKIYEMALK